MLTLNALVLDGTDDTDAYSFLDENGLPWQTTDETDVLVLDGTDAYSFLDENGLPWQTTDETDETDMLTLNALVLVLDAEARHAEAVAILALRDLARD